MTTDADGRVDPDWVGANMAAIRNGADAVCGWAELDPLDWCSLPIALNEDDARECAYDAACDELTALLDPDPADPWPRHTQAFGASLAATAATYLAAGGMPLVGCGEDRAFVAAIRAIDGRIRHTPECRVTVSGRIEGRAAGGMAETIRRRLDAPDRCLDDKLEPAFACARRAASRHRLREMISGSTANGTWLEHVGVPRPREWGALNHMTFGQAWHALEAASLQLKRQRVATTALAMQQAIATRLLKEARRDPARCRAAVLASRGNAATDEVAFTPIG